MLGDLVYRDPKQPAVDHPGRIPGAMFEFARDGLERMLRDPDLLALLLGEALTEPKPNVWFERADAVRGDTPDDGVGVVLDRRTRMMYDGLHVFINGEGYRASGRDARLMQRLADTRRLSATELGRLGSDARALLGQWRQAGWLRDEPVVLPERNERGA